MVPQQGWFPIGQDSLFVFICSGMTNFALLISHFFFCSSIWVRSFCNVEWWYERCDKFHVLSIAQTVRQYNNVICTIFVPWLTWSFYQCLVFQTQSQLFSSSSALSVSVPMQDQLFTPSPSDMPLFHLPSSHLHVLGAQVSFTFGQWLLDPLLQVWTIRKAHQSHNWHSL